MLSSVSLVAALLLSAVLLDVAIRACRALGLVDRPGGRKRHNGAIPLAGGPTLILSLWGVWTWLGSASGLTPALLVALTVLFFAGLWDDVRGTRPAVRLGMALAAAGVVMALDGTVVDQLGNLLGFGVLYLGWLAIPFTLVAYAGVVNATNMIDGVDGLSSGIGLLALLGISLLWIASGPAPLDATLLLGAAVLLPFFVRNFRWYPSRQPAAFMGDSGTMVLGFLLAWGCVRGATVGGIPPVSLLLVAGVPLLDMWTVMARRMRVGRSPFTPGLDHLHHRLLAKGFDARETTLILCTLAVALMAVALGVALEVLAEWVGFGLFAVTLVGALVFMNGHPEPELKSLPTSRPQNLLKPGVSSYPDR